MQKILNKNIMIKKGYLFGCHFSFLPAVFVSLVATVLVSLACANDTFATGHTLSLTNSGDVEISADPGYAATSTDNLEIVSTCPAGYTLSIEGAHDTNLYRDGNAENRGEEDSQTIKAAPGTFAEPAELLDNTWGYKLNPNSNLYAGITTESVEILSSDEGTGDDPTVPREFSVHYGAKLDNNLFAGSYKTDVEDAKSSVVYTLISEPSCESATFESGRYMNNLMATGVEPTTRRVASLPTNKTNSELKSFKEATEEEYEEADADENVEIHEVQTEDSPYPIYLWFDTDTREVEQEVTDPETGNKTTITVEETYNTGANWFSEARNVYFNSDSSYFFNSMFSMDDLQISRIKGEKALNADYMFYRAARDVNNFTLEFPENFSFDSLSTARGMFQSVCASSYQNKLNSEKCSIKLNDTFNIENATDLRSMFSLVGEYYKEVEIELGDNFNAKSADDISYMFQYAGHYSYKTSINFGKNFNVSSATNANHMLDGACQGGNENNNGFCEINLGDNFNIESGKNLSSMFSYVANGKVTTVSLNLGKNFNAKSATNMNNMFQAFGKSAKSLTLDLGENFHPVDPDNNIDLTMQSMFESVGYNATESFNYDFGDEFNTYNVTNMSKMFLDFAHNVTDANITFPDKMVASHATNLSYMFAGICYTTTTSCTITVNDTFNAENATDTSYMFWRSGVNSNNYTLNLGANLNTKSSKNMAYMLAETGQKGKSKINFGNNFRTDEATNMSYMFYQTGYRDPEFSLILPSNFNASKATNMSYMFAQVCHDSTTSCLIEINDNFNPQAAENLSYMFSETAYKTPTFSIDLGDNFNTASAINMTAMFQYLGRAATTFSMDLGEYFNTANVTNMSYMFREMGYSATDFTLSHFNTEIFNTTKVTNMSYMFQSMAYSIPEIDLELPINFNTSNVTDMSYMFQYMGYKATSANIDFNETFRTDGVKNMSYMFSGFGASAIDFELILPARINAHSATNLYAMFWLTCNGINKNSNSCKIKLDDNFNAQNATDIQYLFQGAGRYVKDVEIDLGNNFNAKSAVNIHGMLLQTCADALVDNCKVNLGDNFNVSSVKDFSRFTYYYWSTPGFANAAKNVDFDLGKNFNAESATSMSNMFATVGQSSTGNVSIKLGENFHPIKEGVSVTMAGMFDSAFQKYSTLNLDFGDGFYTSNATSMEAMFRRAASDAPTFNLELPDTFVTSNVTTMKEMFYGTCTRSTTSCSIILNDNFNASLVTNVEKMFTEVGVNPISEVTIDLGDNFNGSNITNYKYMFSKTAYGATEFSIDLGPNFDTSSGQDMSYMFEYLGYTAEDFSLNLGNHFTTSTVNNMSYMFREMAHTATNFTFNNFYTERFNTENVTNMAYMFSYMAKSAPLINLKMPENFDTTNVTNMAYMFQGIGYSASVSSIDFGDSFYTSNVTNMEGMFNEAGYSTIEYDLTLPDTFIASSATNLTNMFKLLCYGVSNVSTSCTLKINDNFNAHSATSISSMFFGIGRYSKNVDIDLGENFNVSSATNASRIFINTCGDAVVESCKLNLGDNFNVSSLKDFSNFFYEYYVSPAFGGAAKSVEIDFGKNFNAESATNMQSMMYQVGYSSNKISIDFGDNFHPAKEGVLVKMGYFLQNFAANATEYNLDFGDNFDTSNASELQNFFNSALRNYPEVDFTLPNKFTASSATNISSMFSYFCSASTISCRIKFPDSFNAQTATNANSMFSNTGSGVPSLSIDLGNGFNPVNVQNFSSMFQSAGYNSTDFNINLGTDFNTAGATNIASMFDHAGYHASNFIIDFGEKFDTSKVTWMYNIFMGSGYYATNYKIDLGPLFSYESALSNQISNMFTSIAYNITSDPERFTIYVPNEDVQAWIIARYNKLNTSNVIVGSMPTSP